MNAVPEEARAALRWLAWRSARASRYQDAERLLHGLTALSPHDEWAWRLRLRIAWERGDVAIAQGAAESLLALRSDDSEAMVAMARLCLLASAPEDAMAWLRALPPEGEPRAQRVAASLREQLGE